MLSHYVYYAQNVYYVTICIICIATLLCLESTASLILCTFVFNSLSAHYTSKVSELSMTDYIFMSHLGLNTLKPLIFCSLAISGRRRPRA